LNFQTMVCDLTGLPIANASLLDEATAAAEAMSMFFSVCEKNRAKKTSNKFFVDHAVFETTKALLETRATPFGIELVYGNASDYRADNAFVGGIIQYPNADGEVIDFSGFAAEMHAVDAFVVAAADLLSLTLLKNPASLGADVVVGNSQRFGVPMGYGGPHAAFFACTENFKRFAPGRIIGVSVDQDGHPALRMALQTREQHIKRERATSNICTAQALLAIMAGMYAVWHGPEGLTRIAQSIQNKTSALKVALENAGLTVTTNTYFDTLRISTHEVANINNRALALGFNLFLGNNQIGVSLNETTTWDDVSKLANAITGKDVTIDRSSSTSMPVGLQRQTDFLTHPTFNSYRSETEMMRYIKKLENKDLSLTHSMIPLGSCTMKLNAATELMPLSWPNFSKIHPFVPQSQAEGYLEMLQELEKDLAEITGFAATSLQPNSGAQGEYAGLMTIRAYHEDHGQSHRTAMLIPSSAHGTNPASAVMAGMKVVVTKVLEDGNIDLADLKAKAELHSDNLAGIMITYPSTNGIYEASVTEVCSIVHEHGGLIYMDGANMNAQVGLTSPGIIGADVCHLNLHKTFAIPHGGGGPGMGPICVNEKLAPYLPGHPLVATGGEKGISPISATPFGSASILLISYAYIKMLGAGGLKKASEYAILNANYLVECLDEHYPILYRGNNNRVAHEFIIDLRQFKKSIGIDAEDVAKRLMDYGFHAPTMSWPVPGTIMIEPTESESKAELDRFTEAMIQIREEIKEVELGLVEAENNVLTNAPHTSNLLLSDDYNLPYSRAKAAYPLEWVKSAKFWPSVRRVNNSHGDRNLVCTCPPIEAYESAEVD
ncbi:MAG: aminomethyl-transferring glycine dehydrogenase, partial [Saprospiraceae bacterium]|nr:aminomethyl-transferring glycine dehydrogenase [Saprospiraceae bacterium]